MVKLNKHSIEVRIYRDSGKELAQEMQIALLECLKWNKAYYGGMENEAIDIATLVRALMDIEEHPKDYFSFKIPAEDPVRELHDYVFLLVNALRWQNVSGEHTKEENDHVYSLIYLLEAMVDTKQAA